MRIIFLALAALIACAPAVPHAEERLLNGPAPGSVKPTPAKRVGPQYPISLASKDIEGRVVVSLTVRADGTVADIVVIESARKEFARAVEDAVRRWRYNPAIRHGRAVDFHNVILGMDFTLDHIGAKGSERIKDKLIEAQDALRAGQFSGVGSIFAPLRREARTLADSMLIDLVEIDYRLAARQPISALSRLSSISRISGRGQSFETDQMERKFKIEAQMGLYGDAVATYRDMVELGLPVSEQIAGVVQQMLALGRSAEPMSIELALESAACAGGEGCAEGTAYLLFRPLRRSVAPTLQEGAVTEAKAICDGGTMPLDVEPGAVWDIAPDWGDCRIALLGSVGTRVLLHEH